MIRTPLFKEFGYYNPLPNTKRKEMTEKYLQVTFDLESDVLYLSLGEPREGIATETSQGIFERRSVETNEVVGWTVTDFFAGYAAKEKK